MSLMLMGAGKALDAVALATNLAVNPSFEVDLSNTAVTDGSAMILDGATISRVTTEHQDRTAAAQIVGGAAGTGASIVLPGTYNSGQAYTASFYAKASATTTTIRAIFGSRTGDWVIPADFTATTTWQRFVCPNWIPGADRTNVALGIRFQAGTTTFFVDAVMVETGAAASAYFDGASANCAWRGAADASVSDRYA